MKFNIYKTFRLILLSTAILSSAAYANKVFIVTSFGPFPGIVNNPTQEVVALLPDYICPGGALDCKETDKVTLLKEDLPVIWEVPNVNIPAILSKAKESHTVIGILSLGYDPRLQYPTGLTLEKYAVNRENGEDAKGTIRGFDVETFSYNTVITDGPNQLDMPDQINLEEVKANIQVKKPVFLGKDSMFGGEDNEYGVERLRVGILDQNNVYVCNATFYSNLYNTQGTSIFGGFVHIKNPGKIRSQDMADAIQIYIQYVINKKTDIQ